MLSNVTFPGILNCYSKLVEKLKYNIPGNIASNVLYRFLFHVRKAFN